MNASTLLTLLNQIQKGEKTIEEGIELLRDLPFSDLGFAKLDHHRELRIGVPEIVWGENKSVKEISLIVRRMTEKGALIIVSRLVEEKGQALLGEFPSGTYYDRARIFSLLSNSPFDVSSGSVEEKGGEGGIALEGETRGPILVLAAGTSDISVAEEAAVVADLLGNPVKRLYDVGISGLHRLLAEIPEIRKASVLIVVAGMEGALPSVVAGLVGKPIIAVPTSIGYGTGLGGVAALMTMLNSCAPGVTVVNIDNGVGAAVAAHLMNRP